MSFNDPKRIRYNFSVNVNPLSCCECQEIDQPKAGVTYATVYLYKVTEGIK